MFYFFFSVFKTFYLPPTIIELSSLLFFLYSIKPESCIEVSGCEYFPAPCALNEPLLSVQHALLESEANQIRASILDMAHCIRTFTDEVSEYSRKLVGIVQQIEGGEQIVEDGVGMAHTEHVRRAERLLFF